MDIKKKEEKVKHIYASEYAIENQKQIKKQFEIITTELTDRIISAKDLSEFNLLMKEGITKGYLPLLCLLLFFLQKFCFFFLIYF